MYRFFSTKPKIPNKIQFDTKGEKLVLQWGGISRVLKVSSIVSVGYLYFLYQLDSDTKLGSFAKYTLPVFGACTLAMFHKSSKFLHRMMLLEGGYFVKFERYPLGGWGHYKKSMVEITSILGIIPYGLPRWYNPYRLGRGFYRLRYEKKRWGRNSTDYVIFKIPQDYEKELLKIIAVGKPVTEQNLKILKNP